MAVNAKSYYFDPKRRNWLLLCTGGLLTAGGLGWCLRLACAKEPKMAIATYLAGTAGICLTNVSFHYRPVKTSSIPNWILLLTGGILSGTGFACCLTIAMEEHPKSTTIAYIVGSLGYILANSVVFAAAVSRIGGKKENFSYSETEVSSDEFVHIVKCQNPELRHINGVYQCENCKATFGGENGELGKAQNKSGLTFAMEKRQDFLRKMQESLLETNTNDEKNRATDEARNGGGLFREFKEIYLNKNIEKENLGDIEKCRDETTQTESRLRMTGTQTQANNIGKLLRKMPQLTVDAEDVPNGDHQTEKQSIESFLPICPSLGKKDVNF